MKSERTFKNSMSKSALVASSLDTLRGEPVYSNLDIDGPLELEPETFGDPYELASTTYSDCKVPESIRYLKETIGEQSRKIYCLDLPLRFFEDVFFPLDVHDDGKLLEFFRKYGVPCVPYFDSRRRCGDSYDRLREVYGRYQDGITLMPELEPSSILLRLHDFLKAKARGYDSVDDWKDDLMDVWLDDFIQKLMQRDALLIGVDAPVRDENATEGLLRGDMKEAASQSELCRTEIFMGYMRGELQIDKNARFISLAEARIATELLRECTAYAWARSIWPRGDKVETTRSMWHELGVRPGLLVPRPIREQTSFADAFIDREGIFVSEEWIHGFLEACISESVHFGMGDIGALKAPSDASGRDIPASEGGIESAIALNAVHMLDLPISWKECPNCGRHYKLFCSGPKDSMENHRGKEVRESTCCSKSCQKRRSRQSNSSGRKCAYEFMKKRVDQYWDRFAGISADKWKEILDERPDADPEGDIEYNIVKQTVDDANDYAANQVKQSSRGRKTPKRQEYISAKDIARHVARKREEGMPKRKGSR